MSESARPQKWKVVSLAFGFWTMLALSYTVSTVVGGISEGQAVSWSRVLAWNLIDFTCGWR